MWSALGTSSRPGAGKPAGATRGAFRLGVVLATLVGGAWVARRSGSVATDAASPPTRPRPVLVESRGRRRLASGARAVVWAAVWVGLVALLVQVGRLALDRPALAVVLACGIFACVLAATDPLALASFAVLGVWVIERVSPGGIDISGSDTLLVMGAVCAAPLVPWQSPHVRRMVTAIVVFEAVLFVTVLAHPSDRALFEWGHRLFLAGGAVLVGAAVAYHGRTRGVFRAFLVVSAVIGGIAVLASVTRGFAPAEVLGYQKNFIGSMLMVGLAISFLTPGLTGFSPAELFVVKVMSAAGLLASQSRGAIIALLVALVVASVHSRAVRRRSPVLFVVLVPLAVFAFFSLRSQIEQPEGTVTSSVTERARYRDQGLEAWRASPVFGQGMRFFESGQFALNSDPHNVVVASLSETGVVGLAALLGLLGFTVGMVRRLGTALGVLALSLVIARFTHGLFDIYWIAGTQSLPWMIVGMALGDRAAASHAAEDRVVEDGLFVDAGAGHEAVRSAADA